MSRSLLVAPDKFRGTATAVEVVRAVQKAAIGLGWRVDGAPMADGGEGTLEVLGGSLKTMTVTGPVNTPVTACWTLKGETAVIEMAQAAGLEKAGGPEGNDPLGATTAGVGELIVQAARSGAKHVLVGCGGSATTDGGLGCVRVLQRNAGFLRRIKLTALVDVDTKFLEAARGFGPQKGASAAQIELLERRLETLAAEYANEFGVDVRELPGSGSAGGLAGGLAAFGGSIEPGFDHLAEILDLAGRAQKADLIITGEGRVDEHSLCGKVTGGVAALGAELGKPVLVVAGSVDEGVDLHGALYVSLTERFGETAARSDTLQCLEQVIRDELPGAEI